MEEVFLLRNEQYKIQKLIENNLQFVVNICKEKEITSEGILFKFDLVDLFYNGESLEMRLNASSKISGEYLLIKDCLLNINLKREYSADYFYSSLEKEFKWVEYVLNLLSGETMPKTNIEKLVMFCKAKIDKEGIKNLRMSFYLPVTAYMGEKSSEYEDPYPDLNETNKVTIYHINKPINNILEYQHDFYKISESGKVLENIGSKHFLDYTTKLYDSLDELYESLN